MVELKKYECQICGSKCLNLVNDYNDLPRITSDCKPFPKCGKLSTCSACGAVQKIPDARWFEEITEIYSTYQAYELADGEEQLVFDQVSGLPRKRSELLIEKLQGLNQLPEFAKVLDVGCGDGVTLRAMSKIFNNWNLNGHELSSSKEQLLKKIPRFENLFTGELESLPEGFDIVSMMHSLEHFPSPHQALITIKQKLKEGGYLVIEVCNVDQNPFDLLVADHLMHFSPQILSRLVNKAGFKVVCCETDWVKKEISLVAQKASANQLISELNPQAVMKQIVENVKWLKTIVESAQVAAVSSSSLFGIFGTSIAASWLAGQLDGRVKFFVDEDPNRIGRNYLGKPVLHPSNVPGDSLVYIALAPALAEKIKPRLSSYKWGKCYPHSH